MFTATVISGFNDLAVFALIALARSARRSRRAAWTGVERGRRLLCCLSFVVAIYMIFPREKSLHKHRERGYGMEIYDLEM